MPKSALSSEELLKTALNLNDAFSETHLLLIAYEKGLAELLPEDTLMLLMVEDSESGPHIVH